MKKTLIKTISIISIVALLLVLLVGCSFTSVKDHYDVDLEGDFYVDFSISCNTVLTTEGALDGLPETLKPLIPKDGYFLPKVQVKCVEGDSVMALLRKICANQRITLSITGGNYVESIGGLAEKMYSNNLGGWMYKVNGILAPVGASEYSIKEGDFIQWQYTCEYGDIGVI